MEKHKIFELGYHFQYLRLGSLHNYTVKKEDEETLWLNGRFHMFINDLEELNVNRSILDEFNTEIKLLEKYKVNEKLNENDSSHIYQFMDKMKLPIILELEKIISFDSIPISTIDKSCLLKLMNKTDNPLFEKKVWKKLTMYAKNDFSDAAKCLLIGASTPATMIMLRATEEVVRQYYSNKTKKVATGEVWGTLTEELEKIPSINTDLISHLNYIRKTRRNLAQHPGKIFSQREAERIFMEVISAVHEIYIEM